MNYLINLFFDVLVAAGPFFVFKQMGTGPNTGKLLFRGLTSSDQSVSFIVNSDSITLQTSGGIGSPQPIDNGEIVYGCEVGITASFLCVDQRSGFLSITGPIVIQGNSTRGNSVIGAVAGAFYKRNSLILEGCKNCFALPFPATDKLCNSVIVGGGCNCDCGANVAATYNGGNILLSNCCSCIDRINRSSIISSYRSNFKGCCSQNSSIISSDNTSLQTCVCNSVILSSTVTVDPNTPRGKLCNSTIISSNVKINPINLFSRDSRYSSVISSTGSEIRDFSSLIISGVSSSIFGTCSGFNSIVGSYNSIINNSNFTTIISSYNSCIDSAPWCTQAANSSLWTPNLTSICRSSIIAGRNNCILENPSYIDQQIRNSTIFSGKSQEISTNTNSERLFGGVIITGFGNSVCGNSCYSVVSGYKNRVDKSKNSVIISGQYSCIDDSNLSIILSSSKSTIIESELSIMIGGVTSSLFCVDKSVIINSRESCITCDPSSVTKPGKYNTIISSNCSKIVGKSCVSPAIDSNFNSIISGLCNSVCCSCNVSIIGGTKNLVYANFSSIIAGHQNKICPRTTGTDAQKRPRCNNSIIGGFCNCILEGSYDSAIVGGVCNCIGYVNNNVNRAVIIGGKSLKNCWSDSTMVPSFIFLGNSYVAGLTGLNGTFSNFSPQIKVRGGLAVG